MVFQLASGATVHESYIESLTRADYEKMVISRARVDPQFKADLIRDPKGTALKAAAELIGRQMTRNEIDVLQGVTITVLEETPSQKYVVIPNGDLPKQPKQP